MSLTNKRQRGGYKHKPFTSISYSIAIMVCADTPKTALTRHTSDSKSREVAAFPPPLPNAHFSRGLFLHPPRWPETKTKTVMSSPGRPRLSPCNLLAEPPTPAPSSLNFPRASPGVPSRSPQDRAFPLARHPLTGGQRRRAGRGRLGATKGRGGRSQVPGGPSAAPDRSPGPRKRKRKRLRAVFPIPPFQAHPTPLAPGCPWGGAGRRAAR